MALREEPYALPLNLGGRTFCRATSCAANTCVLASYFESPSISWMSTSPLVVDGEIVVLPKFTGWLQRSHLRAEWPFAVSLWKRPGSTKSLAFFVYHLAEAAYYILKVPTDAHVALMMGYERAVVVTKDSFLVFNLFDPTKPPLTIPASTSYHLVPHLCSSKSDTVVLASDNTIQEWRVNVKSASTYLWHQASILFSLNISSISRLSCETT